MTEKQNNKVIIYTIITGLLIRIIMDLFNLWNFQSAQLIYWILWFIWMSILFLYGVFPRVNSWKFRKIDKKLDYSVELFRSELHLLSWREILKKLRMYID